MNEVQKLKWLLLSGITETISETPVNRLQNDRKPQSAVVGALPQKNEEATAPSEQAKVNVEVTVASEQAKMLADKATTLSDLYRVRAGFDGCALKKTAAHTLNGRGAENPLLLCYVESPDTVDEREGILMGGNAGALLDRMLGAIGLNLKQSAYVASLIPWRPPGNRKPNETEMALCRPFWEKEIELLKPKIILLFGANVSGAVLGITALSKARGTWHDYRGIPVRVSVSPVTLLKLPAQRRQVWEDLQQVQKKLGEV